MNKYKKNRYDFGGVMKDVGMSLLDIGPGVVTSTFTNKNISEMSGYEYENKGIGVGADIIGNTSEQLAPMGLNMLVPGAGTALSAVSNVSKNAIMANGGRMPMEALSPENTIAEYEGLPHELGGIGINEEVEVEDGEFKYKDMIFTNRF